ncbi:SusD/RagB family nutrient-binding outer membrane lipoprotein [Hymenobacter koreensis]|uniref:SusD/RagB family nutrient-binding outer membrane lipoprotein n=1 Tax=Hymenobacter koreensis TaxID=1084523 RepID=A0ABP8IVH8_9BACT
MKNKHLLGLALAASLVMSTASCSKDEFLDVNKDPNRTTAIGLPVQLTNIIVSTGFTVGNDIGRVSSLLVQHMAGAINQPATYDVYNIRGAFDNQWNFELYNGTLVNSKRLIDQAELANSPAYAGIGKLLLAYNFALTTDMWGDIPYSQALQGLNNLAPRFDKQEDIYKGNSSKNIKGLIELVREGLADLDKPSALTPSGAADPAYAGNIAKWKQMGNTLLLKLATTMSKREPALAGSIINSAQAGAITTNADDFQVPFGTAVGNRNPLFEYNFVTRQDDQLLSQRLLDSMALRNDPRLPVFFNTTQPRTATVNTTGTITPFGTFTGFQNGANAPLPARIPVTTNTALTNRSRYNVYIRGAQGEAPVRILTNFQRLFILAEATQRNLPGFTPPAGATAQSLYRDAIRASMTKAGITDAAVTAYFTANPAVANLSTNSERALNQILTQKWIAWVGNGYEAYNDFRRTGYPRLALVDNPAGDDPTVIPQRLPYPNTEINANNGAEGLDPNIRTSARVWWAQ